MLVYLNQAMQQQRDSAEREQRQLTAADVRSAVTAGALLRVRPIMMTVAAIIAGLLPMLGVDIWANPKVKKMADIGLDLYVGGLAGQLPPGLVDQYPRVGQGVAVSMLAGCQQHRGDGGGDGDRGRDRGHHRGRRFFQ